MEFLEHEKVLKRQGEIGYGSALKGAKNELILTNLRLILEQKNLFGKPKGTLYFNLADIRVVDGEVQVRARKKDNFTPVLEIYFQSSEEQFSFVWEDDVKKWVKAIAAVMNGEEIKENDDEWLAETLQMAETVTGTIDKYKEALGLKPKERVSVKCPSCGATLSGIKGGTVECPYCKTYARL